MTVTESGIYTMPLAEYVADPAPAPSLNAGAAHIILSQSPQHAWFQHPRLNPDYQHEESRRLDLGTIAHALLLEDDASRVVVIESEDWRKKEAKDQRDEARAAGKLPILKKDHESVCNMVTEANLAIIASEFADDFYKAVPEQTLIWQEDGVWCRSRPDKMAKDGRIAFDYKTCAGSVHPGTFGRGPLISHGYDLQACLAVRGIKALTGAKDCTFVFICQEIDPPYSVSFVSLSPQFLAIANERLELALYHWRRCLHMKRWPGYPSRVAYVDAPSYYGMEQLEEAS